MNKAQNGYVSYLLRLWQVGGNGELVWRASLESAQTGQRWNFANLNDVLTFLQMQTSELSSDQGGNKNLPSKKQGGCT